MRGLDAVDDVVACAGYEVAVEADLNVLLRTKLQHQAPDTRWKQKAGKPYLSGVFLFQTIELVFSIAGQDSMGLAVSHSAWQGPVFGKVSFCCGRRGTMQLGVGG